MDAPRHRARRYLNYPDAIKGPVTKYEDRRRPNPVLNGWVLVVSAYLLEWFRFLRDYAWRNAGFGALRPIKWLILEYEPLYEPTVVPLPEEDGAESAAAVKEFAPQPDSAFQYPKTRYYSVADYRALYLSGEATPTDVAKAILPLIRRDTTPKGPHHLGWFDVKVDLVLRAAEASTARYREGKSLGPLDGVPTAVKDEYDMEGYVTCHGSKNDYTGTVTEGGANTFWCVRKLEEAGCVILGKLSMHEFGLDTTGNNPVYGTPPNPHNPGYYTGGSSSGSAYAVSAGLIPFALGSDGGGSIRIPSALCGVFGLKPTHGRLSFRPSQNHCSTCAVLGPIAADIRSLATVFSVVGQPHPTSLFPPLGPGPSLLASSPDSSSAPKLLGVPEAWFSRAAPGVQLLCRNMIQRLVETRGYRIMPIDIPLLNEGQVAHALVVLADGASLLPETNNLTPANKVLLALGRTTPATDLLLAHKLRRLLVNHLAYLFRSHPGLLILTPTTACPGWPVRSPDAELMHGLNDGDSTLESMMYVWMANFCGLPALSVPAGFVVPETTRDGGGVAGAGAGSPVGQGDAVEGKVPVGLMAMADWASEDQLLRFGLDAEEVGEGLRSRPPVWEDVIGMAKRQ